MSAFGEQIRRLITATVDARMPLVAAWCTVSSVSDNGEFCDVFIDEEKQVLISEIFLGYENAGLRLKPAPDELVLVLFVTQASGVVIMAEKTEGMTLMGESFGGLLKLQPVLQAINALQNDVNQLKSLIGPVLNSTPPLPTPTPGSPDPLQAALALALGTWINATLTVTSQGDIENDTIKHGNGE